jgi:spermidine synthase
MPYPVEVREAAGVRTLHFGSDWIQGAMRIARPWHLELEYTREMMASLLLREETRFPRTVLLIGLGAASLVKFLYRHYPLAKLTAVEIEPAVVAAARQSFKLPDDPKRLNIVLADGLQFIAGSSKHYDLILLDGFDANARAGELESLPFYQMCRARLSDHGILAINLLGRGRNFRATLNNLRTAFEDRALPFPPCGTGNVVAFAATGEAIHRSIEDLREQAHELKSVTGLNLLPTLSRVEQNWICASGVLLL